MDISELRKRSDKFVASIDDYIAKVVEHNEKLLQLNKAQLKANKTSKGKPLINIKTGSEYYTPAYAKKKGYKKPDLYDTGDFYKEMDLIFTEPDEYFLTSYVPYMSHLIEMYTEELFGIENKKKAQRITTMLLTNEYKRNVL